MIRVFAPAALLLAAAMPGAALAGDSRLVERLYDPAEVVLIEGRPNVQATIAFAEDELIENVAIGDSASWQVTPNKRANLLFVKPLGVKTATNMTVVTDKRTYLFDLVARPGADALYVLRFTYPEAPEGGEGASGLAQAPERPNETEIAAASDPYAIVDPARLNFLWSSKGDRKLVPDKTYDDGEATFLTWAPGTPIPAILVKNKEGVEGPVNFAVRGDTIVIDGVPREIVLRSGDDVATLFNQGAASEAVARSKAVPGTAGGMK